jgi:MFS family permease
MSPVELFRRNANYRRLWMGQVVSEVGDHFNNIAVFSLVLDNTQSGLIVSGVMLARAIPAVIAAPIAGVVLDRFNRKKVMIWSDVIRFVVALLFILTVDKKDPWLLYVLSGLLMFASPFFTSGRSALLPAITTPQELHTANSLTQTTAWATLTIGAFAGGLSVHQLGYVAAFVLNALSFLFSTWAIWGIQAPAEALHGKMRAHRDTKPWHEYVEGLRYMRANPLILTIALTGVGWASGGGAAQILFSLFGELVFHRGAAGIGIIWGCAGIGLIVGGLFAHKVGRRLSFREYTWLLAVCYFIHGLAYVVFSQMENFRAALFFIGLSRAGVAVGSVLNVGQLLRHVSNEYRGRVFTTNESLVWSTMMFSMMAAGIASQYYDPRVIGAWAGAFSTLTGVYWIWAIWSGRLREPAHDPLVEEHGRTER